MNNKIHELDVDAVMNNLTDDNLCLIREALEYCKATAGKETGLKNCCKRPMVEIELDIMNGDVVTRKGYFCKECHRAIFVETDYLSDEVWQDYAGNYPELLR